MSDDEPASSTWLLPTNGNERICHVLPCKVDFQGMAPTHMFFHTVEAEDGSSIVSSSFRGRGLLALDNESSRSQDNGNNGSNSYRNQGLKAALLCIRNGQIQIKAEVDTILEWNHEHNPEAIKYDEDYLSASTLRGRVRLAQEWSEIAHNLHEPIPIEVEASS